MHVILTMQLILVYQDITVIRLVNLTSEDGSIDQLLKLIHVIFRCIRQNVHFFEPIQRITAGH